MKNSFEIFSENRAVEKLESAGHETLGWQQKTNSVFVRKANGLKSFENWSEILQFENYITAAKKLVP